MTKNLANIGVAVLVVIAIVLGYKIYQEQRVPSSNNQPASTNKQSVTPQASTNNSTATAPITNQLSAEEIAVLNFPGANATDAERKKHADLVNELGFKAIGAAFLDISACKPNPVVYRIQQDTPFKVKNSDAADHTIYTSIDRKTIIKANSEQTLESKAIGDNLGNYGYGCDGGAKGTVGVIQIIPK